jgi:hypothetical protein
MLRTYVLTKLDPADAVGDVLPVCCDGFGSRTRTSGA